jgi:hypothetical protein
LVTYSLSYASLNRRLSQPTALVQILRYAR